MIVWINQNPQSVEHQNRRPRDDSNNIPKRSGLRLEIDLKRPVAGWRVALASYRRCRRLDSVKLLRPRSVSLGNEGQLDFHRRFHRPAIQHGRLVAPLQHGVDGGPLQHGVSVDHSRVLDPAV